VSCFHNRLKRERISTSDLFGNRPLAEWLAYKGEPLSFLHNPSDSAMAPDLTAPFRLLFPSMPDLILEVFDG